MLLVRLLGGTVDAHVADAVTGLHVDAAVVDVDEAERQKIVDQRRREQVSFGNREDAVSSRQLVGKVQIGAAGGGRRVKPANLLRQKERRALKS